jgi:ABC-type multidrug transport system, ATPase component
MMEAIITETLTKSFGGLCAVDSLTFTVAKGEIFGIVGPDGAGKTTTMRLLTSIMEPTSGDAWVGGLHIVNEAEAIKEEIGYMSQRFGLYADLTVEENIDFYADIYRVPRKGRRAKTDRLLAFSNLTSFRKRLSRNLSGGMKQKLGLVCALIHTPKVLFLDEPTNGVDPVSRRDFWRILYHLLHEKVTIFVSTAYLDEAERCNRVGLINKGRLLACGTPEEVKMLMSGKIMEIRSSEPRRANGRTPRTTSGRFLWDFLVTVYMFVTHEPDKTTNSNKKNAYEGRVSSLQHQDYPSLPLKTSFIYVIGRGEKGGNYF